MAIYGAITAIVAGTALGALASNKGRRSSSSAVVAVPNGRERAFLVVSLLSGIYSVVVGCVGVAATRNIQNILTHNPKVRTKEGTGWEGGCGGTCTY
jgi:hypothetical protein